MNKPDIKGEITGKSTATPHSAVIWQGFHHQWEYNHRINRMGSYVAQRKDEDGTLTNVVGHTAASGTGGDTAHFQEFVTEIHSAEGVAFQPGCADILVECQRGDLTPFVIKIEDVELAPELQGCDVYTAVLNGFDIYALEHSEKIITFDIDVTAPEIYAGGTKVRFYIVGHLRFDCRSPECQLLPIRFESESTGGKTGEEEEKSPDLGHPVLPPEKSKRGLDRRKFDKAVTWLKRQLVTIMGVEEVKQSLSDRDEDTTRRRLFRFFGRRFFLRFLKWELTAPYALHVHYLLTGGRQDNLAVHNSEFAQYTYSWDLEQEIHHGQVGVLPLKVQADDTSAYQVNTLAFRHMAMEITMNEELGTEDPIQWGKGMHLLEWHMAIRDIETVEDGVHANLDLFYKCWSEAMNEVINFTTWGAVRGAGSVNFGARLVLLQLKKADGWKQYVMPGRIRWPGGGRSATRDPRARFERAAGVQVREL